MQNPPRDFASLFHALLNAVAALSPEGRALAATFDAVLDDFAKDSSDARRLVNKFRRCHNAGRPAKTPFSYRRLNRMWLNFRRENPDLSAEDARNLMLRRRAREIKRLGLDINKQTSLRDAVAKGEKASSEIRAKRRERWRLVPEGSLMHRRRRVLVTDPSRAAYYRYGRQYTLERLIPSTSMVVFRSDAP
jgi:hypothetical protein